MNDLPDGTKLQALDHPGRAGQVSRILGAALQAVEPGRLVSRALVRKGELLILPDGSEVNLEGIQKIYLIAVGKAALPMVRAAVEFIRDRDFQALAVPKKGSPGRTDQSIPGVEIHPGSHPHPDQDSLKAGKLVAGMLEKAGERDLVLVLLSGGGSSLLCLPAPPLTLSDLQQVNRQLLHSGADIKEINTVRKHLSKIKGGQLARTAHPAGLITLILSDVTGPREPVENALDSVASGPTVPDPTTYQDALQVLNVYRLKDHVPARVLRFLQDGARGDRPETPKPGESPAQSGYPFLIGSNRTAVEAALIQAKREGFHARPAEALLEGEARSAGARFGQLLIQMAEGGHSLPRPACLVAGGETTVTIPDPGAAGLGGRNLEGALAAVFPAAGAEQAALVTLATDGEDGPTPAAGAVVTGTSLDRARRAGLSPTRYLENHNAYRFFEIMGDLILTGPTHTNVNDLWFLFTFKKEVV